jgi:thiosulfate dehydrogenase [quinone] large subunit
MADELARKSGLEKGLILFFRLCMGWTFLWAAIHHFGDNAFVPGFLSHTKTFHGVYAPMATSGWIGLLTFAVEYGHLLIGLSLISGLLVRASAPFAILILLTYWTAHMDFPYIETVNSFLIDYHIVYAGVLVYLIMSHAGHVVGLDAVAAKMSAVRGSALLRWLVG